MASVGLLASAPAWCAEPDLNPIASMNSCACTRGPDGFCHRWLRTDLSWQLYAPGTTTKGLSNDNLEHAIIEAFASWQSLSCGYCAATGTLPSLPHDVTDVALARPHGDTGCVAARCDANPLGLNFSFGGESTAALLASDCWKSASPEACDGAAQNTAQIAFLRTDAGWPLSKLAVSTTFLTTAHDGHIIDADILLRDTTGVFCYSTCKIAQWDVRAALIVELGHAIGLGAAALSEPPTATIPTAGEDTKLPTYVPPDLVTCACLSYRFSTNPDMCVAPDTSTSCDAGPLKPLPHASHRLMWPLALGPVLVLLLVRRVRQRKGTSSAAPQRLA